MLKKFLNKFIQKILFVLAKRMIVKHHPEILAITGSIGKTTSKEMIYEVLKTKFTSIGKSHGNLNTEIGLPLSIFGFTKSPALLRLPIVIIQCWYRLCFGNLPKFLILEMAADKPGDIDYLCQIAPPKYAVVTAVGPSHLAKFESIENVAKDKGRLVANLSADGTAFLNESDPFVKEMSKETKARVEYYKGNLDVISEASAFAVGKFFDIDKDKIGEAINKVKNQSSRLETHKLPQDIWIVDDAYNANPLSMEAAFEHFKSLSLEKKDWRRVAILGEMLDLGDNAEEFHKYVGQLAHENFDFIVGVGKNAEHYKPNRWFATAADARNFVFTALKPKDIVLFKGSHGVGLQGLVKKILADKRS